MLSRAAAALAGALVVPLLAGGGAVEAGGVAVDAVDGARADRPAVVGHRVIGRSVQGRPLHAWRVGDPGSSRVAVLLATLHGSEPAPRRTLLAIRDGAPVHGVDLWLVPVVNPDGLAARDRQNARGVDLNRNFPAAWIEQGGEYASGAGPASEPETRAVLRFLRRIDPRWVVSYHQPLRGVDTYQAKRPAFVRRLAEALGLPRESYPCGGGCHGTLTQWFNRRRDGAAVTVEYGPSPSRSWLTGRAARGVLRAVGGHR